jgi:hypothetical protein
MCSCCLVGGGDDIAVKDVKRDKPTLRLSHLRLMATVGLSSAEVEPLQGCRRC